MSKNRQRGKSYERWLAADLDGRRVGILCREDVLTRRFAIEAKERQRLPAFLKKTMAQAKANCPDDKLALVMLHELHSNHDHDLVIMEYSTFKTIAGVNT
jgi:hypothetical protein